MSEYSPKEAQQILDMPASSLRRYRQVYAEQLSTPDKKRRLTDEDLDKIRTIRDLSGRFSIDEIKQVLEQPPEQFQPEPEVFEGEPPPAMQSIEILESLITNIQDQFTITVAAKDEHINDLRNEIDRLRTELDQAKKPWWKR